MDGTLLDSEHLWEVATEDLVRSLGGELSPTMRAAMTGAHTDDLVRLAHDALGVTVDPETSKRFLLNRTAELFHEGLAWRPGARDLLNAVRTADIPLALVTSTERELAEIALDTLGRDLFAATVCGDEVPAPKPKPYSYRRAAELLGVDPTTCVAVEDSPIGVAAAEAAGCAVLVVPSRVPIGRAPRRAVRLSLLDVGVGDLIDLLIPSPSGQTWRNG